MSSGDLTPSQVAKSFKLNSEQGQRSKCAGEGESKVNKMVACMLCIDTDLLLTHTQTFSKLITTFQDLHLICLST